MPDAKLSSNAFARVSGTGPERGFVSQGTTGGDLYRLNNFTATVNPTLTDDSAAGYSIGSYWYNAARGVLYIANSVALGAAVWRRVRRGHLGYLSGNWYIGENTGSIGASGSSTITGNLGVHAFFVPEPITISDLGFKTAATVSGSTQMALYRAGAAGGRPSTRIAVVASVANAAASTSYSGSLVDGAVALEPGWYWFAAQGDAASTYVTIQPSNNPVPTAALGSVNLATAASAINLVVGLQMTNTFATDPKTTFPADLSTATWTDHTASRFPVGFFKVSAVP